MKRILCLFLTILFVFSLSGCTFEIVSDFNEYDEHTDYNNGEKILIYQQDEESNKWYYYNQLTEREKTIYCEILKQVKDFNVEIVFNEYDIAGKYFEKEKNFLKHINY